MTDWNGRNTTFSYDNTGRRISLSSPNGTKTSYGYDPAGRLTDLFHKTGGGSTIDSSSYTYDSIGNRLSITRPEEKLTYAYDLLDCLIQATPTKLQGKDKTMEHKAEEFIYDTVGNRLAGPETKDTYSYNQGNQLISDRKNQYEYDRNGNLIKKTEVDDAGITKNWTYSYDAENRLIKVVKQESNETKTITFKYDPFGRRIEKKVTETPSPLVGEGGGEGKTYTYVYDNEDILAEYLNKIESGISKIETTKYLHGQGIDEPLEIERKGEAYSYHADGLGSITALSDSRQKAMESYSYSSFGDLKRQGDKVKNTYAFTGREWDEEIELYYYRARYYDAEAGRFISFDPILRGIGHIKSSKCDQLISGFPFQQPQSLHSYVYVGNNAVNRIDPLGLYWQYSQSTGQLTYVNNQTGATTPVGTGYSGNGTGLNNPNMQNVPNTGPIPQGTYNIGQPYNSPNTGPVTMNLDPQPGTNTFGRNLFRIHGDNSCACQSASEGCIILPRNTRDQIAGSGDNELRVVQ